MADLKCSVTRTYKCLSCKEYFTFEQAATDNFKKRCPGCKKNQLLIYSGKMSISNVVDMNKPKTVGSQAEINTKRAEKEGTLKVANKYKPWWRKNKKKIDFDILKKPDKYIREGRK